MFRFDMRGGIVRFERVEMGWRIVVDPDHGSFVAGSVNQLPLGSKELHGSEPGCVERLIAQHSLLLSVLLHLALELEFIPD